MNADFVRERITQLRLEKGVSEYQMSYDLGRSRGYIYNISSGKSLPPMKEFLQICDYFNITPAQFFESASPAGQRTALMDAAIAELGKLDDESLALVAKLAHKLAKRLTEVDEFAGVVRQRAKKYGLPTPANDFFYTRIREIEAGYSK